MHTNSLARAASWVIREKESKRVICETYKRGLVQSLNTDKYEAVPILEYLQEVNRDAQLAKRMETASKAFAAPYGQAA